jgi:hypothetical protein
LILQSRDWAWRQYVLEASVRSSDRPFAGLRCPQRTQRAHELIAAIATLRPQQLHLAVGLGYIAVAPRRERLILLILDGDGANVDRQSCCDGGVCLDLPGHLITINLG